MKRKFNLKSKLNYLGTIFAWALFIILILIAIVLFYYFICITKYNKYGSDYAPPFSIYTIVSPSMTPKINVYDVVVNTKVNDGSEIKKGDIITFISTSTISQGMTITHRVVDVKYIDGEYQYITKGDNNVSEDTAPALFSNVIGIAKVRLPQLGRIQFFVASRFGWLCVVIIPAFWVIISDIIKIAKISKLKKNANIQNEKTIRMVEQGVST